MTEDQRQMEPIASLLRAESTVALATVDQCAQACVAPLYYIADQDLALYWLSSANSLHSRNLARNPAASAAVYRQTDYWKQICGVQMRGQVSVVHDPQQRASLVRTYCERFGLGGVLRLAIRRSTLYAFHPEWFRYIDNSIRFGYTFEVTRPRWTETS
jgi:uncharacterized protein YhbP (UPF0306 family)